jgi:SET domain-containing protein
MLVPKAPFRFLNHSCRPNCELFDWEDDKPDPKTGVKDLYLGVIRKVKAGAELTIDYSWPADFAIPCHCGSKKCRGYIVAEEELHLVEPETA